MPKILQITREFTKPYKNGMAHDKTESAFITAMTKAKFPAYYVGMDSMSGKSRALFMTRYSSFDEWEKDNKIVDTNPSLNADLESASIADGELLEAVDSVVYTLDEDLSYHSHSDLDESPLLSDFRLPRPSRPPQGLDGTGEDGQSRARQDGRQRPLGHV